MSEPAEVSPPADLSHRVANTERETSELRRGQDLLKAEVSQLVKSMETLTTSLNGFSSEIHTRISQIKDGLAARSKTDWRALSAAAAVIVPAAFALVGGAVWLVMTVEGLRSEATDERIAATAAAGDAAIAALADQLADAEAHRAEIDRLIIEEHRRDAAALTRRIERLEDRAMSGPG